MKTISRQQIQILNSPYFSPDACPGNIPGRVYSRYEIVLKWSCDSYSTIHLHQSSEEDAVTITRRISRILNQSAWIQLKKPTEETFEHVPLYCDALVDSESICGNPTNNISVLELVKEVKEGSNETRAILYQKILLNKVENCSTDQELNSKDENGQSLLLLAAYYGNKELFYSVQNKNITFTETNNLGENVLHQAVMGGNLEILDSILERNEVALNSFDLNGNTVMHYIAFEKPKRNVIEICEKLLEAGAIANVQNNFHMTPFHIALNKTSELTFKILKTILNTKKDGYEVQDAFGRTPLQISLDTNNKKVFELLIEHNANPYFMDYNGRTVIHNSVLKEYGLEYLEEIFSSNKTFRGDSNRVIPPEEGLNIRDINGYTALHLAAKNGRVEIFDLIYEQKGVNASTVNEYDESTLFSAVGSGVHSIAEKIIEASKSSDTFINLQNREGTTALHLSIEENNFNITKLLLNNSADPFKLDLNDLSPLALSASYSPLEIVELFSNFDYKVTEMLGLAVANGNDEEVIEYFLSNDMLEDLSTPYQLAAARGLNLELASINITNTTAESQFSQLINEITGDHKAILEELAENDEDESSLSFSLDKSLLNIALFFQGDVDTIKILMNRSETGDLDSLSDVNVTWSPIDIAAFRNKIEIIEHLIETEPKLLRRVDLNGQAMMHKAAWGGRCEALEMVYLVHPQQVSTRDAFGRTPLHLAAMRGYPTPVSCLLRLDPAILHARDIYGFSPLHLAEIYGHHKFFSALQHTSITLPSKDRYMMRYPGVKNRLRDHRAVVRLLLEAGAAPSPQDRTFGWTPLHWAAANGDLAAAESLVASGARVNLPSHSDQTPLYLARFWGRTAVYRFLRGHNAVW